MGYDARSMDMSDSCGEGCLRENETGCYINTCILQWMLHVLFIYLICPSGSKHFLPLMQVVLHVDSSQLNFYSKIILKKMELPIILWLLLQEQPVSIDWLKQEYIGTAPLTLMCVTFPSPSQLQSFLQDWLGLSL